MLILFFFLNKESNIAKEEAESFCNNFYINQTYDSVIQSSNFKSISSDNISQSEDYAVMAFSFSGSFPMERYVCRLEFKENKITFKEVLFID